jgi:hypothetical protein
VKLEIKASKGIGVEIKASGKPDVQLRSMTSKEVALGEHPVTVKGTPETGVPISVGFMVKVIAP